MRNPMMAEVLEMPKPGPKARGEYKKGSIVQRGDHFQISFYDNDGRRRRESFSTLKRAENVLRQKISLRETGKLDEAESRITVNALADLYITKSRGTAPKSVDWIELVWRVHLKPFFGGFRASRINSERILEYRAERLQAGAAAGTVNRELTVFRAMFYHGFNDYTPPKVSRVPKFPEKLKEANPRKGFLTDAQYDSLQANCPYPWLRALLAIAYNFGFSRSELLGLRVEQIDLEARTITLLPGETKSEAGRLVVMTIEVFDLVKPLVEGKQARDFLFTWPNGDQVLDFRVSWRKMCNAAKVSFLLHDFRRSAVRNMIRAGVSRDVAKKISGHQTDSIFSRYNITAENDLGDAAVMIQARREISRKLVAEVRELQTQSVNR
jgi:integrase